MDIFPCDTMGMANDIHVYLSNEQSAQLRVIATREVRSLSNMVRILLARALDADAREAARGTKEKAK